MKVSSSGLRFEKWVADDFELVVALGIEFNRFLAAL